MKNLNRKLPRLTESGYEFTVLAELYAFVEDQIQFPEKAFLIFMSYDIAEVTKPMARKLFNQHRDIIFFWPVFRITTDL